MKLQELAELVVDAGTESIAEGHAKMVALSPIVLAKVILLIEEADELMHHTDHLFALPGVPSPCRMCQWREKLKADL